MIRKVIEIGRFLLYFLALVASVIAVILAAAVICFSVYASMELAKEANKVYVYTDLEGNTGEGKNCHGWPDGMHCDTESGRIEVMYFYTKKQE